MCTETDKIKSLAQYLKSLRKIHTNNSVDTQNDQANAHLIAANIKIQDAIMHLDKAFNLLLY